MSVVESKASVITEDLLDRVAIIESNMNFDAVGDKGKSLGAYQLSETCWTDALKWAEFNASNDTHEWSIETLKGHWKTYAKDPTFSRFVCSSYFKLLEHRFNKKGIKPTKLQLYMAYNMGFTRAELFKFNPSSPNLPEAIYYRMRKVNIIFSK